MILAHKGRRGFSLLEVMVALAIFLLGLVGIGQLITMGGDRALEVQQQSQAIRLCQSKMAEVVSGVVSLTSQPDAPFDEDPDWNWSIDAEQQGDAANLWTIKITVTPANTNVAKVQASLTQLVFDPAQRGSTLDITAAAAAVAAAQAQSSSSNANASGNNSSNNTSGGNQQNSGGNSMSGGGGPGGATKAGGATGNSKTPTQPTQPARPSTQPTQPTTRPSTQPTQPTTRPSTPTQPTQPTTRPSAPTQPTPTRPSGPTK
jgi:prepilin-type N-terminal cleavage/methylation domain-containing protein